MAQTVHIFISTGRFRSFKSMRQFINETYTEDGDAIPSEFISEVGLTDYEPGSIEAIHSEQAQPLRELLHGASWSDQWVASLDENLRADAAICVFSPNRVETPEKCSLKYCGAF